MIARALDTGVPCTWVLGDEIYGADRRLRMFLEQRETPFVLAVRGNEKLWSMLDGSLGQHTAAALAAAMPARDWPPPSARAGEVHAVAGRIAAGLGCNSRMSAGPKRSAICRGHAAHCSTASA